MSSLGFGLERIGSAAVRRPVLSLVIIALFSLFCLAGIPRVTTDHSLSDLFRSSTVDYRNYKQLSERFPTSEFDILVSVEGDNLMTPEALEAVRALHLDVQLIDAVDGVVSIFSMRGEPDAQGYAAPILPPQLPEGAEFDAIVKQLNSHPLIGGKLLSVPDEQGQLTLLIISLKPEMIAKLGRTAVIDDISRTAREDVGPEELKTQLIGVPIMQQEIREAILRDRLLYNTSGFLVGLAISFAFFRRVKLVLITSLCPAISVLWALGMLGWFQLQLNTFINVIPPLVMVIAFTNAMHMVFSIRRRMRDGVKPIDAATHAVEIIGPACVLTSLTTAIAFLSFTLTDSGLIRTFGIAASLSTLMAFVSAIVLVPVLVLLLFRNEKELLVVETGRFKAMDWLDHVCEGIAQWLPQRHYQLTGIGVAAVVLCGALYGQLQPHYRLSDQVPDTRKSVTASERIDVKLTGANPVDIMLSWPAGKTITSPDVVEAIGQVHALIERQSGVGNVWSLETLSRWLRQVGETDPQALPKYLRRLPKHVVRRFVNEEAQSALVTGRLPNLDANDAVPLLKNLDKQLNDIRSQHPNMEFTVTGLSALAALQSSNMIHQLNWGMLSTIVVVILLIGLGFRSVEMAVLSIVPNLIPVLGAGAVTYLTGGGLEYASVISLTVAFGIAVDDTIHFLSRFKSESDEGKSVDEAVNITVSKIGPVLMLTSVVLVVSMAVTVFSDLPPMRKFGEMLMGALAGAIFADMLITPAIVLTARKMRDAFREMRSVKG